MLKHATIGRANRAQQMLSKPQLMVGHDVVDHAPSVSEDAGDLNNNNDNSNNNNNHSNVGLQSQLSGLSVNGNWLTTTRISGASCSSSPTPSLVSTPTGGRFEQLSSAPSSVFNSPSKSGSSSSQHTITPTTTVHRPTSGSMIKIFAQTLSQEVEYVTLHLNAQTKSQQIVRSLLKKFRLKHRDPNLFYLTLERWLRKDGIKQRSVMLLSDDACPLQLQQCCSNPPHNDIKFTLQMRSGALLKIFCADVCSDTKYKCLSLATQTTVEETIGLMLHCLNLTVDCESKQGNNSNDTITHNLSATSAINHHRRQASSPSSTGSTGSSASSTSSSSGIESDLMNQNPPKSAGDASNQPQALSRRLDASSRTSSITSISSASNVSSASVSQTFSEHYCLVIECANTNYKRVLEADDFLVEIYQGLLDEARDDEAQQSLGGRLTESRSMQASGASQAASMLNESIKQQPDQWFVIKLKRRDDPSHFSVKFANPRQNMPLPPIPSSMAQFNNANDLQLFVSTTQIELNPHHQRRFASSNLSAPIAKARCTTGNAERGQRSATPSIGQPSNRAVANTTAPAACPRPPVHCHQRQMSERVSSNRGSGDRVGEQMQPPPEKLIWLPAVRPRRRNLSNASTTFGRPQNGLATGVACNRRRYDPAQLADDLNKLNLGMGEPGVAHDDDQVKPAHSATSDMSLDLKPVIEQTRSSGTPIETPGELAGRDQRD